MSDEKEAPMPVAAVLLAAGGSRRMGQTKQLLPIDGQPMVRRVAQTVCQAGLAQVVAVVGAEGEGVARALADLDLEIVHNQAWQRGMSTSVRAGIEALRPEIEAALLVLADQPGLTLDALKALVEAYRATRAPIVAPYYQGRRGNPVLFARSLFADLGQVEGDQGGRALLVRYERDVARVDLDDAAILLDVDTRQDYEGLCSEK
ncbi:MAG: nucleotidyltransferase family protein [Anaerolineaceae bacterium]|nr:nucleotidyltransferase family protein [Anaerolineaceae bacterium]